jgi:4-amino-4-deoxy-L-arabinose transferase-like glycosyltransferase
MTDMPVTFFFSLALLLTLGLLRRPTYWLSVVTGIAIGAGLLSKYTSTRWFSSTRCCSVT